MARSRKSRGGRLALGAVIAAGLAVPFALAIKQDMRAKKPASRSPAVAAAKSRAPRADAGHRSHHSARARGQKWQQLEPSAMSEEFFHRELAAAAPGLAGDLANVRLGMTRGAIERAGTALGQVPAGFPAAVREFSFAGNGASAALKRVVFRFPDDGTARRVLTRMWGAPSKAPGGGAVWINARTGARALLSVTGGQAELRYEQARSPRR